MIYDTVSAIASEVEDAANADEAPFSASGQGRRRVRWAVVATASIATMLVAIFGAGLLRPSSQVTSPLVGKRAPAFDLPVLTNGDTRFRSADSQGRVLVVNFWASWCIPCREENGVLDAFYRRRSDDVELVGVLYGDTPDNALLFREEYGGDWPLVDDPGGRTALDFGLRGVPETFVIGPSGRVAARMIGAVDAATLDRAVTAARRGAPPVTAQNDSYRTQP